LVVAQPELKCQRVVLFRQDSRTGRIVAAASPLAQRAGVRLEMPLAEAKSLLYRSSGRNSCDQPLHILAHDPAADLYAIEKLAGALDGFSPIVGLQQDVDHPDCIFLDISGLAPLFRGELKLAQDLDQFCRERGLLVEMAIAYTIGQAQALVQFRRAVQGLAGQGLRPQTAVPLREDRSPPRASNLDFSTENIVVGNIFVLHRVDVLKLLPIAALRIADRTIATLQQLGVVTIGQLLNLPRRDLAARFGNEIHRRLDQLSGKLAEPIITHNTPAEFSAERLLDYPVRDRETMKVIMQELIEEICTKLAAAQQGALQWTIRLYGEQKLPLKLDVSLFEPTATFQHVVQLAIMQLEQLLMLTATEKQRFGSSKSAPFPRRKFPLSRDNQSLQVNEITVSVTSCVLLVQKQRQLFDENPRLDQQELAHLINRLSGRMGRQNVVYPVISSGAQPEFAFQFRPFVDPHRKRDRRIATAAISSSAHAISRPLRMFRPAICLEWEGSNKTDPLGAQMLVGEQTHTVAKCWGPERIETGWWRGPTARRDYWRVETETHQQFWIYLDLRRRRWFLHGEF